MHLALRLLGVGPGDEVFCPTFTFVATANPIAYFPGPARLSDSDRSSWNLDPNVPGKRSPTGKRRGKPACGHRRSYPSSGRAAHGPDHDDVRTVRVPVLEDAAEALGTLLQACRLDLAGRRVLVQRQQDRHDDGRRNARGARSTVTSGALLVHAGSGSGARLRALGAGLQLPDEQRSRRHRSRAARGPADRVRRRREIASSTATRLRPARSFAYARQCDYGLHTNWLSCFLIDPEGIWTDRDG